MTAKEKKMRLVKSKFYLIKKETLDCLYVKSVFKISLINNNYMLFFFQFILKTKFIYIFCLSHSLVLDNVNKTQELGIYVRNTNLKQFYTKRAIP